MARTFTIHTGRGRYVADTPIDAAKKAAAKLFKNNKAKSLRFCIRETTKDSKKKLYYYKAYKADKNAKDSIIVSVDKSKKTFSGGSPTHGYNPEHGDYRDDLDIRSKMHEAFQNGFAANLQETLYKIFDIHYYHEFYNLIDSTLLKKYILGEFTYIIIMDAIELTFMKVTNKNTRQIRYFYFKEGMFLCSLFPLTKEQINEFLSEGTLTIKQGDIQKIHDKILKNEGEQKKQEQERQQRQERQERTSK
jgi:hypothetical protein